jgi:hypothetical protein
MKSVLYSLTGLIIATVVLTAIPVGAEQPGMTDEHIARIKTNCRTALSTLGIIHANDAPTYINRNQTYFSIGDKLMSRLNSRLTVNHYDVSGLASTTGNYNEALTEFRNAYKLYDDTMADILHIDCVKQPVSFYDKVAEARQQRQKVNESLQRLKDLIGQYQQGVETFKVQYAKQLSGDGS